MEVRLTVRLGRRHVKPIDLAQLNPGIRQTVRWLRENGFETSSSGDGVTHECVCDSAFAYVTILVEPWHLVEEADRLLKLVEARGVKLTGLDENGAGTSVEACYWPAGPEGLRGVLMLGGVDDAALGLAG